MSYQSVNNKVISLHLYPPQITQRTLAGEGVDDFLLDTLLALGQAFVLRVQRELFGFSCERYDAYVLYRQPWWTKMKVREGWDRRE